MTLISREKPRHFLFDIFLFLGHGSTDLEDSSRRRHMSDAPIGSPNKQLPPLLTTTRRGSTEKIITNTNNSKKSSNEDLTNLESLLESQKDSDTIKKQLPDFCSCWCNGRLLLFSWNHFHAKFHGTADGPDNLERFILKNLGNEMYQTIFRSFLWIFSIFWKRCTYNEKFRVINLFDFTIFLLVYF